MAIYHKMSAFKKLFKKKVWFKLILNFLLNNLDQLTRFVKICMNKLKKKTIIFLKPNNF